MRYKKFAFILTVLLIVAFLFVGCAKKEEAPVASTPAPAVQAAPAAAAAPAPAPIDKDALLMEAAKGYFAAVATGNNMITAKDVQAMIEDNPDAIVIIDIRTAADFEAGHISGSYHSGWAQLGEVMEHIPQNRQVVVTCYSGQTAGQAIATLRLAGFSNVRSLQGGMNGWRAAGLEATETGLRSLSERAKVSSPRTESDNVLWEAAKNNFLAVGTMGNKLITSQNLYDTLQTNPRAFNVIDIRSKDDFDAGHIEFSKHSAWPQFGSLLNSFTKQEKIVVACYSGQTSGQTVGILRMLGYDAYSLQSGINNGWKPANLPLVQ